LTKPLKPLPRYLRIFYSCTPLLIDLKLIITHLLHSIVEASHMIIQAEWSYFFGYSLSLNGTDARYWASQIKDDSSQIWRLFLKFWTWQVFSMRSIQNLTVSFARSKERNIQHDDNSDRHLPKEWKLTVVFTQSFSTMSFQFCWFIFVWFFISLQNINIFQSSSRKVVQ
jgi:hypothetical protein